MRGHEVVRPRLAVLIALVVCPMLVVACASGGARAQDKASRRCARSSRRVLSVGPDPVGYARSAAEAITKADDALNGACPGVAP